MVFGSHLGVISLKTGTTLLQYDMSDPVSAKEIPGSKIVKELDSFSSSLTKKQQYDPELCPCLCQLDFLCLAIALLFYSLNSRSTEAHTHRQRAATS